MSNILEVKEVTKTYSSHTALNNVSLSVPKGAVFGLLGPNGAGKTSLIRIINQITGPDKGSIFLDGQPLRFKPDKERLQEQRRALDAEIEAMHPHMKPPRERELDQIERNRQVQQDIENKIVQMRDKSKNKDKPPAFDDTPAGFGPTFKDGGDSEGDGSVEPPAF